MSSFLERQKAAFASNLQSASDKIQAPKRPAPVSPSPSVASTTSVTAGLTPSKKSKRDATATIFSQPENTGVGQNLGTQIVYAVEFLKQKQEVVSLQVILEHLNLDKQTEDEQKTIAERLQLHPRIKWNPDGTKHDVWNAGTYEHYPIIPNVKNKTSLLRYLQQRQDAQGVPVKDLKDGWPDCEGAITDLEKEHKVLVIRTKKDNHPRMVWLDDPSLFHEVEDEFKNLWHKVELPSADDIVRRLISVGQKPTSEDPRLKAAAAPKEKKQKKRAAKRTGKSTNMHMEHLLKDYSHLKK